jgi:hypothetical protein
MPPLEFGIRTDMQGTFVTIFMTVVATCMAIIAICMSVVAICMAVAAVTGKRIGNAGTVEPVTTAGTALDWIRVVIDAGRVWNDYNDIQV